MNENLNIIFCIGETSYEKKINKTYYVLKKQIKPNFKTLGPKFGQEMKLIANKIAQIKNISLETVMNATNDNINQLFDNKFKKAN